MSEQGLAAWKLPLIVAAISVSIVGGFYLGGPGLGMAVGGLAAATIVVMAVRHPPRGPILPATAPDGRRRLLVVLDRPLEDGEAVESLARRVAGDGRSEAAEVLLIAPCRNRRLDRWASDLGPGRHRAQRDLVLSAASLAKAGIAAQGRVGDEDLVQMVEDELGSFAATEVILVGAGGGCEELDSRLCVPFRRLVVDPPAHPAAGHEATTERSLLA
jgi:hypothetical protein